MKKPSPTPSSPLSGHVGGGGCRGGTSSPIFPSILHAFPPSIAPSIPPCIPLYPFQPSLSFPIYSSVVPPSILSSILLSQSLSTPFPQSLSQNLTLSISQSLSLFLLLSLILSLFQSLSPSLYQSLTLSTVSFYFPLSLLNNLLYYVMFF